jgi:hypothetical protein
MRNEAMTAASPMAMLAIPILWMVDEKPPSCPCLILHFISNLKPNCADMQNKVS